MELPTRISAGDAPVGKGWWWSSSLTRILSSLTEQRVKVSSGLIIFFLDYFCRAWLWSVGLRCCFSFLVHYDWLYFVFFISIISEEKKSVVRSVFVQTFRTLSPLLVRIFSRNLRPSYQKKNPSEGLMVVERIRESNGFSFRFRCSRPA